MRLTVNAQAEICNAGQGAAVALQLQTICMTTHQEQQDSLCQIKREVICRTAARRFGKPPRKAHLNK